MEQLFYMYVNAQNITVFCHVGTAKQNAILEI